MGSSSSRKRVIHTNPRSVTSNSIDSRSIKRTKRREKSTYSSIPSNPQHQHQQQQKQQQQQQQQAATTTNNNKTSYSWLNNPVENGYIYHPKAGWIIHPSFYDDDEPLCNSKHVCKHKRDCREVRMRMAVYQYIRAEEKNTPLSYREVELLWGVSHSTVQRRKIYMQSQSDVYFLMTPFKPKKK